MLEPLGDGLRKRAGYSEAGAFLCALAFVTRALECRLLLSFSKKLSEPRKTPVHVAYRDISRANTAAVSSWYPKPSFLHAASDPNLHLGNRAWTAAFAGVFREALFFFVVCCGWDKDKRCFVHNMGMPPSARLDSVLWLFSST